jgi:hypothetical protein
LDYSHDIDTVDRANSAGLKERRGINKPNTQFIRGIKDTIRYHIYSRKTEEPLNKKDAVVY